MNMRFYASLALIVLLLSSCGNDEGETKEPIRQVKFAEIGNTQGNEHYTFSGSIISENEVDLSFKVAGILSSVNVKLGDKVDRGLLIAAIEPADYTIQSNQAVAQKEGAIANKQSAEANAKAAESQLINAQSTYDRVSKLYENNSLSLSEYQQAKAGLDAAQAQYDAAMSQVRAANSQVSTAHQQLQAANNQVNYTRLVSPISGVVTRVLKEANELVNAGSVIATVSSFASPEVQVGVPETVIGKLKNGQTAEIRLPSLPDQTFEAVVSEISFATGKSTTYPVVLKIVNPKQEIIPGMAAEVKFEGGSFSNQAASEVLAPIKSVGSGVEGNFVYRLLPSGQDGVYEVKKTPVVLGEISDFGFQVKEGLQDGELVATAGLSSLFDGKKVRLQKDSK